MYWYIHVDVMAHSPYPMAIHNLSNVCRYPPSSRSSPWLFLRALFLLLLLPPPYSCPPFFQASATFFFLGSISYIHSTSLLFLLGLGESGVGRDPFMGES